MTIKLLGAFLVFAGCGSFGFSTAASFRGQQRAFEQLLRALEFMHAELSYRMPPLSALCRSAGAIVTGPVQKTFLALADELDCQVSPDVKLCMAAALNRQNLPENLRQAFLHLGDGLGRFDLPGQLRGLDIAQSEAKQVLQDLRDHRENRLRSYQTLGLCAGASLAILFL